MAMTFTPNLSPAAGPVPRLETGKPGMTNIKKYNWGVKDEPGTFQMIPKRLLFIDHDYQRALTSGRVLAIARDWSWIGCGVIMVACRPGEVRYMVMDGQHRKAAADKRADIDELPCMVFKADEIKAEAGGFLIANTLRRPLSMVERFKALNITEDWAAAVVEELARMSGRDISRNSSSKTLTCVGAVMECAQNDEKRLRAIWPTIVELCAGNAIPGFLVKGMFFLEGNLLEGNSLAIHGRWGRRLVSIGYGRVVVCVRESNSFYGEYTSKITAVGIVKAINAKAKTKIPHTISGFDA